MYTLPATVHVITFGGLRDKRQQTMALSLGFQLGRKQCSPLLCNPIGINVHESTLHVLPLSLFIFFFYYYYFFFIIYIFFCQLLDFVLRSLEITHDNLLFGF